VSNHDEHKSRVFVRPTQLASRHHELGWLVSRALYLNVSLAPITAAIKIIPTPLSLYGAHFPTVRLQPPTHQVDGGLLHLGVVLGATKEAPRRLIGHFVGHRRGVLGLRDLPTC